MMKNQEEKKEKQSEDLVSLNDSLYNEFSLEELENRLETDHLLFGNLVEPLCFLDFSCVCKNGGYTCISEEGGGCPCDGANLGCPEFL